LLSKSIPPYCVADEVTNVTAGIKLAPCAADAETGKEYLSCPNGTA